MVELSTVAFAGTASAAAEGNFEPAGNDIYNTASLQRGARNFMNYCSGCHSAKYVRYNRIAADLGAAHKDIRTLATQLEVMRWGHAMVKPRPGFLWGGARQAAASRGDPQHTLTVEEFDRWQLAARSSVQTRTAALEKSGVKVKLLADSAREYLDQYDAAK